MSDQQRKEIKTDSPRTFSPYIESEESRNSMQSRLKAIDIVNTTPNQGTSLKQKISLALNDLRQTLRRQGLRQALFKAQCWVDKSKLYDSIAQYDQKAPTELEYTCKRDFSNIRVAVYTAIYGGYDTVNEPVYVSPGCDYIIFTDADMPKDSVWRLGDTSGIEGFDEMDAYHKSKYVKVHPHKFLQDYDYSIWVDGTTSIVGDLIPLVDRIGDSAIGMFEHPHRDCIFTEGNAIIYYNLARPEMIRRQLKAYRKEGMPRHYGLSEATIIIRRHGDALCRELMESWWGELTRWSMRDQISLPYVMWRKGLSHDYVYSLGRSRRFNPRFYFGGHKKPLKF